jgi:hypothetical protein
LKHSQVKSCHKLFFTFISGVVCFLLGFILLIFHASIMAATTLANGIAWGTAAGVYYLSCTSFHSIDTLCISFLTLFMPCSRILGLPEWLRTEIDPTVVLNHPEAAPSNQISKTSQFDNNCSEALPGPVWPSSWRIARCSMHLCGISSVSRIISWK